jgi:hypothetical protein
MNTPNKEQIAREAAASILEIPVLNQYMIPEMAAIIQAAIDQATANAIADHAIESARQKPAECNCVRMEFESHKEGCPAGAASSEVEWTEERLNSMWSARYGDTPPPLRFIDDLIREQNEFRAKSLKHLTASSEPPKEERGEWRRETVLAIARKHLGQDAISDAVADAHNAALKAERERRERAESRYDKLDAITENEIKSLRQQLLAAQAAIAAHNAHNDNEDCAFIDVDLSALREHDERLTAEVREPLVEALRIARTWLPNSRVPTPNEERAYEIIDAALASVKDGK